MDEISVQRAEQILNQHFKLFLEKQKEAGYQCQILLDSKFNYENHNYFYVQFCKENECAKCYKITC
ncbi:MAG: hypothetical protein CVV23_13495 [Ignavibacteriae bacterium HGW-Ignavibacteriae-2]|jgi:hypothetical protein|nr:MAG: hypothetical protein CVV23_13495 [Ignavibacteriae bacterium HGW-Ignavibacteriae-2]